MPMAPSIASANGRREETMFRRLSSFTLVLALSVLVASCGHQVTPSPTTADLSGHITVKFQTNGALDFTNVTYVIAIDSCGSGVPYPNAFLSGYASYTFAFLVGGGTGSTALPELFQYYLNPSNTGNLTKLLVNNLNPSTTQFIPNYNGQSNEFAFTFLRSDLNNPFNVALPCPNSTPVPSTSPSTTPTTSPTVSAGASPTATPTGTTASAAPTASPSPSPIGTNGNDSTGVDVPPYLDNWTFNLMTFAPNGGGPLDSLGLYGPTDTSFSGIVVDTSTTTTANSFRQPNVTPPQLPAAYITYGEVDTYQ